LQKWFQDLEAQIAALVVDDNTLAGRKIQQLVRACPMLMLIADD
jgi:hypothetical protein